MRLFTRTQGHDGLGGCPLALLHAMPANFRGDLDPFFDGRRLVRGIAKILLDSRPGSTTNSVTIAREEASLGLLRRAGCAVSRLLGRERGHILWRGGRCSL